MKADFGRHIGAADSPNSIERNRAKCEGDFVDDRQILEQIVTRRGTLDVWRARPPADALIKDRDDAASGDGERTYDAIRAHDGVLGVLVSGLVQPPRGKSETLVRWAGGVR
jgi:hypothetical protein